MAKEPIIIFIDVEIKELIPGFLENRNKETDILKKATANSDFDTLQTIGHRLKGSSGGYGFKGLGDFGAALEKAAKEKNISKAGNIVVEILDYLERIVIQYDKAS